MQPTFDRRSKYEKLSEKPNVFEFFQTEVPSTVGQSTKSWVQNKETRFFFCRDDVTSAKPKVVQIERNAKDLSFLDKETA